MCRQQLTLLTTATSAPAFVKISTKLKLPICDVR